MIILIRAINEELCNADKTDLHLVYKPKFLINVFFYYSEIRTTVVKHNKGKKKNNKRLDKNNISGLINKGYVSCFPVAASCDCDINLSNKTVRVYNLALSVTSLFYPFRFYFYLQCKIHTCSCPRLYGCVCCLLYTSRCV